MAKGVANIYKNRTCSTMYDKVGSLFKHSINLSSTNGHNYKLPFNLKNDGDRAIFNIRATVKNGSTIIGTIYRDMLTAKSIMNTNINVTIPAKVNKTLYIVMEITYEHF